MTGMVAVDELARSPASSVMASGVAGAISATITSGKCALAVRRAWSRSTSRVTSNRGLNQSRSGSHTSALLVITMTLSEGTPCIAGYRRSIEANEIPDSRAHVSVCFTVLCRSGRVEGGARSRILICPIRASHTRISHQIGAVPERRKNRPRIRSRKPVEGIIMGSRGAIPKPL